MQYIHGEARNQGSLFPVSLEELVPDDHLVRVIEAYVGRLDLGVMGFGKVQPRKTGRPSYDPADLLKLYPQTMAVWQRPLPHAPFQRGSLGNVPGGTGVQPETSHQRAGRTSSDRAAGLSLALR